MASMYLVRYATPEPGLPLGLVSNRNVSYSIARVVKTNLPFNEYSIDTRL